MCAFHRDTTHLPREAPRPKDALRITSIGSVPRDPNEQRRCPQALYPALQAAEPARAGGRWVATRVNECGRRRVRAEWRILGLNCGWTVATEAGQVPTTLSRWSIAGSKPARVTDLLYRQRWYVVHFGTRTASYLADAVA